MKIAVLSDIHANYVALQTVSNDVDQWQPDMVIVAGDLVNRGPRPRECLEFVHQRIQDQNWFWLRGNHEDYVIGQAQEVGKVDKSASEVHRASRWTLERLNGHLDRDEILMDNQSQAGPPLPDNLDLLKNMPYQINLLDPDGKQASFVHASRKGIREGIYPETSDEALSEKMFAPLPSGEEEKIQWISPCNRQEPLSLFAVGHTHRPLIRQLSGTLVVNAGSAGLPFDRDTRPSYACLTHHRGQWQAEIRRCEYDLHQAEKDFFTSGYLDEGGPLVKLVLIELRTAQSQLYHWAIRYQERALKGEISMGESVDQYLSRA